MERKNFQDLFLPISFVCFLIGLIYYLNPQPGSAPSIITNLTERDIALEQAIKSGSTSYTYETSFLPGIGYVDNQADLSQQ